MHTLTVKTLELARLDTELRPLLIQIVAKEFGTKNELDAYLKEHPKADKSKHTVTDRGEKSKEDEGPSGFLNKIKGLVERGQKALSDLSERAQKTLTDPEARKDALSTAGKAIKDAPAAVGKKLVDHFKNELHEVKGGIGKVMQGGKPSKAEAKAMFGLAVEVAAAATVISTGGAAGAAGFFGKSVAKHIAMSAIHPMLGNLHILQEMGHVGHVLGQIVEVGGAVAHHAAEEKDPKDLTDDEQVAAFVNFIMSAVTAQLDKGLTDEDVAKALNGDHPELDYDSLKNEDKDSKSASSVATLYNEGRETISPRGAPMTATETSLRRNLIRLASTYPKGSDERLQLLKVITTAADFDPSQIGEVIPGALEEGTPEESYQGDQFTQQEFSELGMKQESGGLGMTVDETEARLPNGQQDAGRLAALAEKNLFDALVRLAKDNKEARGPVLTMLREAGYITPEGKVASDKFAGCEKLPEGGMRDNCEKKKEEGKKNDDKKAAEDDDKDACGEDKVAAMPTEDTRVREGLIRLAKSNPEFASRVLPLVVAFDKEHGIDHAALLNDRKIQAATQGAKTALDAAKTAAKTALSLGYDKAAAVAAGKKAHAAFAA